MKLVFADSFFFIAMLNKDDRAHNKARILKDSLTAIPVTTDWVLSEVADGMAAASGALTALIFWMLF